MRIAVTLPRDRRKLGRLHLFNGETEVYSCSCYGKSDSIAAAQAGNPTRDQMRRNGDTPAGLYRGTIARRFSGNTEKRQMEIDRTFGKWPPIRLRPTFQIARTGLLIHGGHPSPTGGLRPTHGCLRVFDVAMLTLIEQIRKAGITEFEVKITEV